ncbi:hypothetical protein FQZ97_1161180 [compost metagenome]
MEMAKYLQGLLGRLATINTELMQTPWEKKQSEKKKAKAMLQAAAISLFLEKGLDRKIIADNLGVTYKSILNWTAGLKRAA